MIEQIWELRRGRERERRVEQPVEIVRESGSCVNYSGGLRGAVSATGASRIGIGEAGYVRLR